MPPLRTAFAIADDSRDRSGLAGQQPPASEVCGLSHRSSEAFPALSPALSTSWPIATLDRSCGPGLSFGPSGLRDRERRPPLDV